MREKKDEREAVLRLTILAGGASGSGMSGNQSGKTERVREETPTNSNPHPPHPERKPYRVTTFPNTGVSRRVKLTTVGTDNLS